MVKNKNISLYRNALLEKLSDVKGDGETSTNGAVTPNVQPPYGKNSVRPLSVLSDDRAYYQDFIIPYINGFFPEKVIFADLTQKNVLYGLIDKNLNPILPSSVFMKSLPSGNDAPQYAMDFVVDAFSEMNLYLSNAAFLGKISTDSPFYNLRSFKSYKDPNFLVKQRQNNIKLQFLDKVKNDLELSSKIKDANGFNKKFLETLKELIKTRVPITKTANIFSNNFKTFDSGLIIDIAKDKADDDKNKYRNYLHLEEFFVFAEACKRFGFLIDQNVPWRILADLNSPAMTQLTGNHNGYMRRYDINGIDELFAKRYNSVVLQEIEFLKDFFYQSYYYLITEYPAYEIDYKKLNVCDFNKQTTFFRESLNKQQYFEKFPDTYWLRMYVYLKNYEESRNLNQTEFDNIVREANNFTKLGKLETALFYVNDFFKEYKKVSYFSSLLSKVNDVNNDGNTFQPELVF